MSRLRQIARVASFVTITPAMLGAFALHDAVTSQEHEQLRDRWVGVWCSMILRSFGIRVLVIGESPKATADHGRLVVSNHRGVADVLVLLRTFGGRMVSRADLSKWPLIGIGGRKLGTVFVDRSSKSSGAATIRAMRDLLVAKATVTIFPEGTTFAGDEVHPFHPGGMSSVIGSGAPVVPVGLAYSRGSGAAFLDETFPEHLARMAGAAKSFVVVSVGAPIEAKRGMRAQALAEQTRQAVIAEVTRARAEADRLL